MTSRVVTCETDRKSLLSLLENKRFPFNITIADGKKRSIAQNRLQRLWINEAAEQLGEYTAEEYRAYCKAWFGLPILCEDQAFADIYNAVIKPLNYEDKLKLMAIPLDFDVTRKMTVAQKQRYLDAVYEHFTGLGVMLTQPENY
jgi:hypothetical protein